MILIFLGSWRSTLIITVSIPLAVLSSLIALSLLGQTINVMTLGGLALAVGILVDDATVTIENINRHMEEHGEDILTAITRGAQEIMPPATVALFCICIAFVPLLALGGVAGYLFRPLAMAVVFAMIASYILTYTLVPTMAHFLLRNQHQSRGARRVGRAAAGRTCSAAFSEGSRPISSGFGRAISACCNWRCSAASCSPAGFICVALLSLGLAPFLGQDFFPLGQFGAIKIHMRAPTGTRIEETTLLADQVEQKIRTIIPPDRLASIVDNIGLPISGINISYGNTGTIGVFDADILVTLSEGATPTDVYVKSLARAAADGVSRHDVLLPAGRYRQPDPQLRLAGADRRPDRRRRSQRQPRLRQRSCWRRSAVFPGSPIRASRKRSRTPALKVDFNRELAGVVGPHRERRLDQHPGHAVGQHPDRPDLLAQPRQRRVLPRFGPDAAI